MDKKQQKATKSNITNKFRKALIFLKIVKNQGGLNMWDVIIDRICSWFGF